MPGFRVLEGVLWSPPSPEEVRRLVDRIYRDPSLQRDLPSPDVHPAKSPSIRLPSLGVLPEVLLWVLVGVVAVLLALWIAREVAGRRRRATVPAPRVLPPPDASSVLRAPFEEASALAAQGRWTEAIHALLLKTLETLVAATGTVIPSALTSREILARIPLKDEARGALGVLVDVVQASHFGGAAAGPDDYARCLDRFRRFAAAYGRAAA